MTKLRDLIEPEEFGEIIIHHRASCHHCVWWYGAQRLHEADAWEDLIEHLVDRHAPAVRSHYNRDERNER